jgi:cardiolipin synthase A/B
LELLNSGEDYVPAMLSAIEDACISVDVELYRVDPGNLWQLFFAALVKAAARGTRVRLLVDSFGSRRMRADDWQAMECAAIITRLTPSLLKSVFTQVSTRRDHRKLLVVDGEIGFIGGMSIDDTFFRPINEPTWRESMVRAQGPVVTMMQRAFNDAWNENGGSRHSDSSDPAKAIGDTRAQLILSTPNKPRGESLFIGAAKGARRNLFITNPFVVPSNDISRALIEAVRRNVDVRLLVPGRYHRFPWIRDAMRGFYSQYLRAGIRLFEYNSSMLHAKTITVDNSWASVGSFNLDPRSFFFNDEAAIAACGERFAIAVAAAFADDCRNALEVTLDQWQLRGIHARWREASVALLRKHL